MSFFTHDLFPFLSRINQACTMMMMMMIASTAATKYKKSGAFINLPLQIRFAKALGKQ
jgi:hypothetical protein